MARQIAEDKSQPIHLGRAWKREVTTEHPPAREPDAPEEPTDLTASQAIRRAVDDVVTAYKTEQPTEADVNRLRTSLEALATLADAGYEAIQAVKNGAGTGSGGAGSTGGGARTWLTSAIVSAVVALGAPNVFGQSDQALAAVLASQLERTDDRLDETDDKLNKTRIALGRTIEWLSDEQFKTCSSNKAIARGLNWVAKQMPADENPRDRYEPIVVECDPSPYLPTDLDELRVEARRADTGRR